MRNLRTEKFNSFDTFFQNCQNEFKSIAEKNPSHEYFEKHYMLNIVPGSRHGGNDKRIVEVFYGSKPFDFKTKRNGWEALSEYGASLLYQLHDKGFVTVTLTPARTDNLSPIEDYISYQFIQHPKKLNNPKVLKKHFDNLIAYMEVTSLDGNPSLYQKFLVWKLRYFKRMVVKSVFEKSRFLSNLSEMVKFSLQVGLSGFIIYLFTIMNASQGEVKTETLLNKQAEVLNKLDSSSKINNNLILQNQIEIRKLSNIDSLSIKPNIDSLN